MCTVSFLPLAGGNYILTSNRDERLERPAALSMERMRIAGRSVYFPKDPQAGGSWIATTGEDVTVCLLNGGWEPHSTPPGHVYRKSRGVMVLEFFEFEDSATFLSEYDFDNIEPFTLVIVESVEDGSMLLSEVRWDGKALSHNQADAKQPHIWSSVTLYPEPVRQQRSEWFALWQLSHSSFSQVDILQFHRFSGSGDPAQDLVMNAGDKRTVSICSIERSSGITKAVYEDLLKGTSCNYLVYH